MNPVFRIDSFSVPDAVLGDFRAAALRSLAVIRTQPGYVRDQWFERVAGAGRFNIVTLVEWDDAARMPAAGEAVKAVHAAAGFDVQDFLVENGIDESRAVYAALAV